jgi:hypothetical protein
MPINNKKDEIGAKISGRSHLFVVLININYPKSPKRNTSDGARNVLKKPTLTIFTIIFQPLLFRQTEGQKRHLLYKNTK